MKKECIIIVTIIVIMILAGGTYLSLSWRDNEKIEHDPDYKDKNQSEVCIFRDMHFCQEYDNESIITLLNSNHAQYSGPTRFYDAILFDPTFYNFTDVTISSSKTIIYQSPSTCMPSCILSSVSSSGQDLYHLNEQGAVTVWICHKLRSVGESIRILGQDEHGVFRSSTDEGSESTYTLGIADYLLFSRNDTNMSLEIYSDANYTILRDVVTLHNFSSVPLHYLAAYSSFNDGNGPKDATYIVGDFTRSK